MNSMGEILDAANTYVDTDTAIASINEIGLDHYLLKPWSPPQQHLFPVLDDLLDEWQATVRRPFNDK